MTQVTSRAATLAAPQASLREERVLRVRAATFSRRALAVAIDAIILLGLVASVIGLTALLLGIRMPAPHELGPDLLISGILDRDPLVLGALGLLVGLSAIYQLCLGGVFGQTFGLRVCGLRIISSRGTLPGPAAWPVTLPGYLCLDLTHGPRLALVPLRSRAPRLTRSSGWHVRDSRSLARAMATGARNASQRFEERLIHLAGLDRAAIERARHRQRIYGGALDTALLELGLVEESTIRAALEKETRLPALPRALLNGPVVAPALLLDPASSRKAGAIAYALDTLASDGMTRATSVQAIVRLDFDVGTLARTIGNAHAQVFIAPEVHFEALWGAFYEQPISERFLTLLGRLMGASPARQWAAPGGHRRVRVPSPTVDVGPRPSTPEPPGSVAPAHVGAAAPEPARAPARLPDRSLLPARELARLRDAYIDLHGSPLGAAIARELLARVPLPALLDELPALVTGPPPEPDDGPRARAWLSLFSAAPLSPDQLAGARSLLTERLAHPEARCRTWAALALASLPKAGRDHATVARLVSAFEADPDPTVRSACLHALRDHLDHPAVSVLRTRLAARLSEGDARDALNALSALVCLRDAEAIPTLIESLPPGRARPGGLDKDAVHAALLTLTAHDLGTRPKPWRRWWQRRSSMTRAAWLIEALASPEPRLRIIAIEELVALTGQRLGYYFDLPLKARKQAIARWRTWALRKGVAVDHERASPYRGTRTTPDMASPEPARE